MKPTLNTRDGSLYVDGTVYQAPRYLSLELQNLLGLNFLPPVEPEPEPLKVDHSHCSSSACKLAKDGFHCVCRCKHSPAHGSRVREHNHVMDEYNGADSPAPIGVYL
jgi:hypothetical protein